MDNIKIERTERTPEVNFDFSRNTFVLRGESYPENVPKFYGDPIKQLQEHLNNLEDGQVSFDFDLVYFNSTSAKVIINLFETLDAAAERGLDVTINWHYDADDDNSAELGEEFGEDLESANFKLCPRD
ncbi:MAG: DUF1987 domain-containing protein [Magnetococcales bacterium]|nr:DUF1987 domain-containing protein [Magnetococcales bacterium]